MRCSSFCTAESYSLSAIAEFFKNKKFKTKFHREVLYVSGVSGVGDAFFFSYGCFIVWGLKKRQEEQLINEIKSFSKEPLKQIKIDRFIFRYGLDTTIENHERFNADIITLEDADVKRKLAISYGLSQAIQLEYYEDSTIEAIKKNNYLSEELAKRGKISLSRKDISKRMGEIFLARSSVNLNSEFLDVPEYFWRYPNFEEYYKMITKYLDLHGRVDTLNQKLNVLHELFDMLTAQLQHRYSSMLEIAIIALIFVEILINVFHLSLV